MPDFELIIGPEHISSLGVLEVPVIGPGNTMVILTGVGRVGLDVDGTALSADVSPAPLLEVHAGDGAGDDRPFDGVVLIRTGYLVVSPTRYRDIGGDGGLRHSTYVTLANLQGDDIDQSFFALDAGETFVDDSPGEINPRPIGEVVVRMRVAVMGDCTLEAIAYHVHLLLHQDDPELAGRHPTPTGEVTTGGQG